MIIIINTVQIEKLIDSVKCSCLSILSVQHHIINNSHILINFPCLSLSIPTDFSTVIKTNLKCHASVKPAAKLKSFCNFDFSSVSKFTQMYCLMFLQVLITGIVFILIFTIKKSNPKLLIHQLEMHNIHIPSREQVFPISVMLSF